jgi:hypothetical protein
MIAVLIALSFAVHATHAHKPVHRHPHKHARVHKLPVDRCAADARRVEALELRISSAADNKAELERLEAELERTIRRAQQDCRA